MFLSPLHVDDTAARDALHILPLSMVPLALPALRRVRMVKNPCLESMVEVFRSNETGSGQVKVDALTTIYSEVTAADLATLTKLSQLPTFDVYSLRVLLRTHGISVEGADDLRLSERKQHELQQFMHRFTRPLVMHVFGDDLEMAGEADIKKILSSPDAKRVRRNLGTLAEKLKIQIEQVPRFLEDYGDIFLSVSYYQQCLAKIEPVMADFELCLKELRDNHNIGKKPQIIRTCDQIQTAFDKWRNLLSIRFRAFEYGCDTLWVDVDAVQFQRFRNLIKESHVALGAILCALTVKMEAWMREFPEKHVGSLAKRADFIVNNMRQGLGAAYLH